MTARLRDAQAFTRGYLIAMDWANSSPREGLGDRVPRLADEDMTALYRAFRALPVESRDSMRITWAKREPLRRLDERVGLHSSWMTELLGQEPSTTLLLALGELKPEMGREVLRTLWPKVRPAKPDEAIGDVPPLHPTVAAHLRRHLYSKFRSLTDAQPGPDRSAKLLDLDASEVWLVAQELGRAELSKISEGDTSELIGWLDHLPMAKSARLRRWLQLPEQSVLIEPKAEEGDDTPRSAESNEADSKEAGPREDDAPATGPHAEGTRTEAGFAGSNSIEIDPIEAEPLAAAMGHLRVVLDLAEPESSLVGLLGLRVLGLALSSAPRDYCLHLAQKMTHPTAQHLVGWRDGWATSLQDEVDATAVDRSLQEVLEKVDLVMERRAPATT